MSIIKVNCPSCKSPLQIPEVKLRETQGRVVCHECQHIFRLVKKNKQAAPRNPIETSARPVFNEVGSMDSSANINRVDPIWPTDDWPSGNQDIQTPPPKTQQRPQTKKKKAAARPNYRVPKAAEKPKNQFADVGQQPFAFNLLDPQTANMQIPQVSINPTASTGDETASPPAIRPTGSEQQQNNITIHTGSLVFTLVGDGQNSTTSLTAPENAAAPQAVSMGVPPPPVQQGMSSSELNWTIATIAALILFIIQSFYLVLMLS